MGKKASRSILAAIIIIGCISGTASAGIHTGSGGTAVPSVFEPPSNVVNEGRLSVSEIMDNYEVSDEQLERMARMFGSEPSEAWNNPFYMVYDCIAPTSVDLMRGTLSSNDRVAGSKQLDAIEYHLVTDTETYDGVDYEVLLPGSYCVLNELGFYYFYYSNSDYGFFVNVVGYVSTDGADGWAIDAGLGEALDIGLIPASFVGKWQQSGRVFAAEAMVKFIEVMESRSMGDIAAERGFDMSNSFLDTENKNVTFLREATIVGGIGGGYFDPDGTFTRAAMVAILGQAMERFFGMNLDGYPLGSERFNDVSQDYYDKYIGWAAEEGIVGGYGGGVFAPDDPITNQQLGILFLQALGKLG